MDFTISDGARAKLSEIATSRGLDPVVRVGLRSGGCKGFEQFIELSSTEMPGDHILDLESVKILVDKKSFVMLADAILEWKKSLLGNSFELIFSENKSPCSCGKSFSL